MTSLNRIQDALQGVDKPGELVLSDNVVGEEIVLPEFDF